VHSSFLSLVINVRHSVGCSCCHLSRSYPPRAVIMPDSIMCITNGVATYFASDAPCDQWVTCWQCAAVGGQRPRWSS